MIRNKLFLLVVILTMSCNSCKGQNKNTHGETINSSYTSINESVPFEIQRDGMSFAVPDSLKNFGEGSYVALEVFIDKKANLAGFNIKKLLLKAAQNEKSILDYSYYGDSLSHYDDYQAKVKRLYPLLKEYVGNLKVVANKSVEPDTLNKLSILVRLR